MTLTFEELVDELHGRPAEELDELAQLARRFAIEQRRAEILANALEGRKEWESGKLVAFENVDDLMNSLKTS